MRHEKKANLSWKYIWKTYNLSYNGITFDDDNSKLDSFELINNAHLKFVKKYRKKAKKVKHKLPSTF